MRAKLTFNEIQARNRDRSRAYWEKRRARGQCQTTNCHNEIEVNPETGEFFWRCASCRKAVTP